MSTFGFISIDWGVSCIGHFERPRYKGNIVSALTVYWFLIFPLQDSRKRGEFSLTLPLQ